MHVIFAMSILCWNKTFMSYLGFILSSEHTFSKEMWGGAQLCLGTGVIILLLLHNFVICHDRAIYSIPTENYVNWLWYNYVYLYYSTVLLYPFTLVFARASYRMGRVVSFFHHRILHVWNFAKPPGNPCDALLCTSIPLYASVCSYSIRCGSSSAHWWRGHFTF